MTSQIVTFSLPKLKALVKSETSCVSLHEKCHRTLTLHPYHLENLKASVRELLNAKVTTYDIELQGIILSHKNVKILNAVSLSDDSKFRLNYYADIYLFKPLIGSTLTGQVNKKSQDHLGVLVHSLFNVAIAKGLSRSINFYKVGDTVTFKVTKLDFTSRLPYIRGELISQGNNHESTDDIDSGCQSGVEGDSKLSKKKKKPKHTESMESEEIMTPPVQVIQPSPLKGILKSPPPSTEFLIPSTLTKHKKHKKKVEIDESKKEEEGLSLNLDNFLSTTPSLFGDALGGLGSKPEVESEDNANMEVYSQDMFAASPVKEKNEKKRKSRGEDENEEEPPLKKHKRKNKENSEESISGLGLKESVQSPKKLSFSFLNSSVVPEVSSIMKSLIPPEIITESPKKHKRKSKESLEESALESDLKASKEEAVESSPKKHKRKSKSSEEVSDNSDKDSSVKKKLNSSISETLNPSEASKKHKRKSKGGEVIEAGSHHKHSHSKSNKSATQINDSVASEVLDLLESFSKKYETNSSAGETVSDEVAEEVPLKENTHIKSSDQSSEKPNISLSLKKHRRKSRESLDNSLLISDEQKQNGVELNISNPPLETPKLDTSKKHKKKSKDKGSDSTIEGSVVDLTTKKHKKKKSKDKLDSMEDLYKTILKEETHSVKKRKSKGSSSDTSDLIQELLKSALVSKTDV